MARINAVDAAFDLAAAETGVRNSGSQLRVCAKPEKVWARRWTPAEDEFLRANLGRLPEAEIARRLRRTTNAVHLRWVRQLHLPAPSKCEDVLSAECVAIGLGMDSKSVHKLIDRGLMPGRRLPTRGRVIRLVDRRLLAAWLLDPCKWAYIHPDRIGELRARRKRPIPDHYAFAFWEDLGRLARAARRRWHDAWLTPGQVEKRLRLPGGSKYVNAAISKATLPATRWGNWWIRKSAIPRGKTLNYRGDWVARNKKGKR